MKHKALAILFVATPVVANEQVSLGHTCSYFGEDVPHSVHTFASDVEAEDVIQEIMDVSGLPKNFVIKSAGVPNAAAVVIAKRRYILYNQSFMHDIKRSTGSDWSAYSIMAHEVGHHLAGHTLDDLGSRPSLELEADKYSGFILQKLGASLDDAKLVIDRVANNIASSTHPAKHDRLAAIANGWIASCQKDRTCNRDTDKKTEQIAAIPEKQIKEVLTTSQIALSSRKLEMKTAVKKLQVALNNKGCQAGPADGVYGKKTSHAITWLFNQEKKGITQFKNEIGDYINEYHNTKLRARSTVSDNIERARERTVALAGMEWAVSRHNTPCRPSDRPKPYIQPPREENFYFHLRSFWNPPSGLKGGESCDVKFYRDKNSKTVTTRLSSCDPRLKKSVEAALSKALPFPPKIRKRMWSGGLNGYQAQLKYNPKYTYPIK